MNEKGRRGGETLAVREDIVDNVDDQSHSVNYRREKEKEGWGEGRGEGNPRGKNWGVQNLSLSLWLLPRSWRGGDANPDASLDLATLCCLT